MQSYATLFFVSFILCLIIIISSGYGFSRRGHFDEAAVQSAHSGFVPRVGGLAIYISILVLIPLLSFGFIPLSVLFDLDIERLTLLILSAAPVFSVGLAEDLGYDMSPKARLVASAVSSLIVILLFKVWLDSLGLYADTLLMFAPVGILFTIFATVGLNAFNLIDGLNGLSSYVTVSSLSHCQSLLFEPETLKFHFWFSCRGCIGVYGVKFPMGKIFLGDGGAYAQGHLLVWSAIILINGAIEVSAFAILLVFSSRWRILVWPFGADGNQVIRQTDLTVSTSTTRDEVSEIRFLDVTKSVEPFGHSGTHSLDFSTESIGRFVWDDFGLP